MWLRRSEDDCTGAVDTLRKHNHAETHLFHGHAVRHKGFTGRFRDGAGQD